MSSEAVKNVTERMTKTGLLTEDQILSHTRFSDDSLKQSLCDVDALWSKYRLVAYTPTIEAGIDFSASHFHSMFVYCCRQSTAPLGVVQMTGRVRNLASNLVRVCAPKLLNRNLAVPRITIEESRMFLRWKNAQKQLLYGKPTPIIQDDGTITSFKLPDEDATFEVLAHNEVALVNGQTHFFTELEVRIKTLNVVLVFL